jgi:hypothetical protein
MPTPTTPGIKNAVKTTTGGFNSACFYSGAVAPSVVGAPGAFATGSDVMLFSGAGRLDELLLHQHTAQSGLCLPIVFYDAHAPVSGGPIPASGHKLVAFTQAFVNLVSGQVSISGSAAVIPGGTFGVTIPIAQPFQSGLCFNSRSGQCGVTVTWTPELANQ